MASRPPRGFATDPDLPEGFTLDADPPAGFTLDNDPPSTSSGLGAFGRGVAASAVPTAAGVAGFGPGAAAGLWAASPVAALSGPLAPIVEGGGALVGGLAGSGFGGWLAGKAQDAALHSFPTVARGLGLDDASMAADRAQHPYASFAGELAPQAAFLRPGWSGAAPALIGAGISGASEAAREYREGQGFDPIKLGASVATGALLQHPTRFGRALGLPSGLGSDNPAVSANDDLPPGFTVDDPAASAGGASAARDVVDPLSGKSAPAIDPETGASFFSWGEDSTGNRFPNYGAPDPAKAAARAATGRDGRLVVDVDGGVASSAQPGAGLAPAPVRGGASVIDGPALRAAASDANGDVSMSAAGDHLRSAANDALANGGQVTLHVDGKAVPITAPGLTDDQGQRWGAMPILASEPGRNNRLEVRYPDAAPNDDPAALPPGFTLDAGLSSSADVPYPASDAAKLASLPPGFVVDAAPFAANDARTVHPEDYEAQQIIADQRRRGQRGAANDPEHVETLEETARLDLEHAEQAALDAETPAERVNAHRILEGARANFEAVTGKSATGVAAMTSDLPPGFKLDPEPLAPTAPLLDRPFVPDAVMASTASRPAGVGPFGPVHSDLTGNYEAALHRLSRDQAGEVPGALSHPAIGPIDLPWGVPGTGKSDGFGLSKIVQHHPEVVDDLPNIVAGMNVRSVTPNRVQLESPDHLGGVRLDYDGERKAWLLTAMQKEGSAPASTVYMRADADGRSSTDLGAAADIRSAGPADNLPPGFTLDEPSTFPAGRPLPRASQYNAASLAGIGPQDVMPRPANTIGSLDEAVRANPGTFRDLRAPDERDSLEPYTLNGRTRRNPIDLVGWLRQMGGIREQGGELAHAGIDNQPRQIDFARDEGFLGKLVRPDGMPHDEAARAAWEAGFFPDHAERPDVSDFLDALRATHDGGAGRVFHPDDYGNVDAFYAARQQRGYVEQAQQQGSPLAEDVGQPVGLADLDANQPPATAYDDLVRAGGKVGNIRLDGLNSARDIGQALQVVSDHTGGFTDARRGKMAQAETEALASELNMTAADLLKRRRGQALNAEQALAARQLLAKSGDELVRLAGRAKGGSDADVAAFRTALTRHTAIQEQVSGMTAEAGRLLAQFKMTADSAAVHPRMLRTIIESAGGRARLEDIADKIVDLEKTPAGLNNFAAKALKPGWIDKLTELYINSLLSGPRTHATNIGGNLMTMLWTLPEHALTAGIGSVTRSPDKMTFGDVGARAMGMIHGARDGLRLAARSFRTENPIDGESKVEAEQYHAISGLKGKLVRIPTRALTAEDEFFKAVAYRGELNALAAREASKRGGTRAERAKVFSDLRDNPTEAMVELAKDHARYITFQAPLKSAVGQGALMISRNPVARIIVPFVRTPTNILKFAVERSPFAPALGEFRDAIRAGGVQRDQAMSRVVMGSGLAAMAVMLAKNGMLTGGGPTDRREVQAMRDAGWQPYSVKVGDRYYSYQRVDPFARILSTAADFTEFERYMTPDEREQFAAKLGIAVARNVSTMPLLDPASSFFNALSDPDRFLTRYVDNLAASAAVPQAVAQFNSIHDPYLRDTDSLLDTVKARVPGLSNTLPARTNLWGDPIMRSDALGPNILSPISTSTVSRDPVLNEVARLQLGLSKPSRTIGGQRMTAPVYDQFVANAGRPAKAILEGIMATPQYQALPDGPRRMFGRGIVTKTRDMARMQILMSHPDLLRAEVQGRIKHRMGER